MPLRSEQSVTTVARLACDAATARRLADALTESFGSGDAVVAAFEDAAGGWTVEVHFAQAPDAAALRDLVATIAGSTRRARARRRDGRGARLGRGEPGGAPAGVGRTLPGARRP